MRGILLQDWVTIRGSATANGFKVTQGSERWLDLGEIEDVFFHLDVRETTGTNVTMNYETSPTKQDASFVTVVPPFSIATGIRTDRVFANIAPYPVARYLRWKLGVTNANAWDATFRIWLSTYAWVKTG